MLTQLLNILVIVSSARAGGLGEQSDWTEQGSPPIVALSRRGRRYHVAYSRGVCGTDISQSLQRQYREQAVPDSAARDDQLTRTHLLHHRRVHGIESFCSLDFCSRETRRAGASELIHACAVFD